MSESLVWNAVLTTTGFTAGLSVISSGINSISSIVGNLANNIKTAFSSVLNIITSTFKAISSTITSVFSSISTSISSIINPITVAIGGLANIVSSVLSGAFNILKSAAESAYEILSNIAKISFEALIVGIGAVTAAMGMAVNTAAEWEKGMAGISKVTDIEKGTQAYVELNKALKDVWASGTSSKEEVQAVAKSLGAMGITDPKALASATNSVLMMGSSFDMSSDEAAKYMAMIANLDKEGVKVAGGIENYFNKVGSGINILENQSVASAQNILTMMRDAYANAKSLGIDLNELAAFGTVGIERGLEPSELETILRSARAGLMKESTLKLSKEGKETGKIKGSELAASLLGISEQDWVNAFDKSPIETFLKTIDAVGKSAGSNLEKSQKMADIFGQYGATLNRYTGAWEDYQKYLSAFNDAYSDGTGLQQEYMRSTDNLIDKFSILKNTFSRFISEIGSMAMPIVASILPSITNAISNATEWINKMRDEGYSLFDILRMGFESIWNTITTEGPQKIRELANSAINFLRSTDWEATGRWIGDQISKGIKSIEEIFSSVNWGGLFESLKSAFVSVAEGIRASISNNFGVDIAPIYNNYRDLFISIAEAIISSISSAITIIGDIIAGAMPLVSSLGSAFVELSGTIYGALMWAVGQDYWTVLLNGAVEVVSQIAGLFGYLLAMITDTLSEMENAPSNFIQDISSKISGMIPGSTPEAQTESQASTSTSSTSSKKSKSILGGDKVITDNSNTGKNSALVRETKRGSTTFSEPNKVSSPFGGSIDTSKSISVGNLKTQSLSSTYYVLDEKGITGYTKEIQQMTDKQKAFFELYGKNNEEVTQSIKQSNQESVDLLTKLSKITSPEETRKTWSDAIRGELQKELNIGNEKTQGKTLSEWIAEGQNAAKPYADQIKSSSDKIANAWKENRDVIASAPTKFKESMESLLPKWESPLKQTSDIVQTSANTTTSSINSTNEAIKNTQNNLNSLISGTKDNTKATIDNTESSKQLSNVNSKILSGTENMSPDEFRSNVEGLGNMFYPSFVGPSSEYRDFAMKTKGYVPKVAMLGSIAPQYNYNQDEYFAAMEQLAGKTVTVNVDADTNPAESSIDNLKSKIVNDITKLPVDSDTTMAYQGVDAVVNYGNMQEIAIPVYTYDAGGYMPSTSPSSYGGGYNNWGGGISEKSIFSVPGHASGLTFVPYDNYLARLHKGERVLTADENRKLSGLVSISYAPVISIGANVAKEEIERMMEEQLYEHSVEIEKMIVNKIKGNR